MKQKKISSYDDLSPVGWHPSEKLIQETIELSKKAGVKVYTRDDAIEALHNVVHFFRLLAKMDREQKAAKAASEPAPVDKQVSEKDVMADSIDKYEALASAGSYVLIIQVSEPITIEVGRLGTFHFNRGFYAYCGSAKLGIGARVQRHLRKHGEKKLHWHIDHLLDSPAASVLHAWAFTEPGPSEHDLVNALLHLPGFVPGPKGFGSSDCVQKCGTHLVRGDRKPNIEETAFPIGIVLNVEG